jgi:uncharacterized membrane protein
MKSYIYWIIGVSTLILFTCSILRHELFQSASYDLGIFDQAIYLISQGKEPITTIQGFHILGDHAAWIHYLLAIPYKIYPSVYWLFFIQALALSLAALPTWYLALKARLKESQAIAMVFVYLLYPVVFNANLFDFHPEVIAVPTFLAAVFAAQIRKLFWFCIFIILITGCKEVLSLTVIAMGIWLLVFENRRAYGLSAIIFGVVWFILATKLIIPFFSGAEAAAVDRYSYLGNSVFDIIKNLISQPRLAFSKILSLDNLVYLILLLIPVIWGLSIESLKPLVAIVPCIAINILADYQPQKDLVHQYSLPILPFLILAVISSLAAGKGWLQNRRAIIIWSLVTFLCLAKFTYFGGQYLEYVDNWQATRQAISLVSTPGSVYTTAQITPHLSHRVLIKFTNTDVNQDVNIFDYVLLNVRHPGWTSTTEFAHNLVNQLNTNQNFNLQYNQDDVYLFVKNTVGVIK